MLNGLDPIIIFQLYKKIDLGAAATKAKVPLTSTQATRATFAIIPIYLAAEITGVWVDSESKNIDIDTDVQSLFNGDSPIVNQKTLGSLTTIKFVGKQSSIGLTLLLSLIETILDKVTSQEYEITYMNGATTVFGGLIHSFSFSQGDGTDLYQITMEISKGRKAKGVVVPNDPGSTSPLNQGTSVPQGAAKPTNPIGTSSGSSSSSAIVPGLR